jgi:hypothetical protein
MKNRIRVHFTTMVLSAAVLAACEGGSYEGDEDNASPTQSPDGRTTDGDTPDGDTPDGGTPDGGTPGGGLMNCFNQELYDTGSTFSITYEAQKSVDPWYESDVFEVTETRTVLGTASFNGEDDAIEVAVSVHWDTTASGGEHEEFVGEFKAYYALNFEDLDDPRIRYLGSTKQNTDTLDYEPWETADPPEVFPFALVEEGDSYEQELTVTTDGVARAKIVVMNFGGSVTSEVPAGDVESCMVTGTGFAPLLYMTSDKVKGAAEDEFTPFVLHLAKETGIPVFIEFVQGPSEWGSDPTVHMEMVSATLNGERVF